MFVLDGGLYDAGGLDYVQPLTMGKKFSDHKK